MRCHIEQRRGPIIRISHIKFWCALIFDALNFFNIRRETQARGSPLLHLLMGSEGADCGARFVKVTRLAENLVVFMLNFTTSIGRKVLALIKPHIFLTNGEMPSHEVCRTARRFE